MQAKETVLSGVAAAGTRTAVTARVNNAAVENFVISASLPMPAPDVLRRPYLDFSEVSPACWTTVRNGISESKCGNTHYAESPEAPPDDSKNQGYLLFFLFVKLKDARTFMFSLF
jgi:hypothetical protein